MKLDPYLTLLTKINSRSVKDSHVRPKIVRLLEENIIKNIFNPDLGDNFFKE